ncbi:hypothetical protein [Afipia felis]
MDLPDDLELMSVAEAINAAKEDGCSDHSIAAATAALAAKEERLHEGAFAAAFIYSFAKSFTQSAEQRTGEFCQYMNDPAARGCEVFAVRLLRENNFDVAAATARLRHGPSPSSLSTRIEREHGAETVGGSAFAAVADAGSTGWDKAVKNANARTGATVTDLTQTKH